MDLDAATDKSIDLDKSTKDKNSKKGDKQNKKSKKKKKGGCCSCIMPGKNFRCSFMLAGFMCAGYGAYIGAFEVSDDLALPATDGPPPITPGVGSTVLAALFGYTVGPLMLFYGFKIKELIVVLNSLIANGNVIVCLVTVSSLFHAFSFVTSGIDSFVGAIAYMNTMNAEASGGSLMPSQMGDLLGILLASFTLAVASLKVKKLRAAIKGGVIANLVSGLITDQIPPQFG